MMMEDQTLSIITEMESQMPVRSHRVLHRQPAQPTFRIIQAFRGQCLLFNICNKESLIYYP